jgi:hypothetical protein
MSTSLSIGAVAMLGSVATVVYRFEMVRLKALADENLK